MIKEITLQVGPEIASSEKSIRKEICRRLRIADPQLNDFQIIRRSIDARKKDVKVVLVVQIATDADKTLPSLFQKKIFPSVAESSRQILIVGAGSAGLFAALKAIELGIKPIIFERGKTVDNRRDDIVKILREKRIIPESNYCFGEGGAGAFSDGKLFTRSKKRGNVGEVLNLLVQHGAKENILFESHPHIGSDRLPQIIKNIRTTIVDSGGEIYFESKVSDLLIENDEVKGLQLEDGRKYYGPVVLATGHSAHDVYRMLNKNSVLLEPKGLAIGVRLEHPRRLIDRLQYHSSEKVLNLLPSAEYSFVTQVDGRGVYSFCMCPGGVIVPAGTSDNELVVNGMSASARSSRWSNSGMVVEIHPGDITGYEHYGNLEMLYLQEELEKRFFEKSDHSINAPAQRMRDFVEGKDSTSLPATSYLPGIHAARFDNLLPGFIYKRLQKGFLEFDRKRKGFLTNEAILVGLESRTSSPVRIPRSKETLSHVKIKGLYPAGEGAGYAGGIVSAALDGINCIIAFDKLNK